MGKAHLPTQICPPDAILVPHSLLGIRGDDDLEGLIKSQLTLPSSVVTSVVTSAIIKTRLAEARRANRQRSQMKKNRLLGFTRYSTVPGRSVDVPYLVLNKVLALAKQHFDKQYHLMSLSLSVYLC